MREYLENISRIYWKVRRYWRQLKEYLENISRIMEKAYVREAIENISREYLENMIANA
jgi:hypothetical protein